MSEPRRQFTVEFKREAVQLIEKRGLSVSEAARRLEVGTTLLRKWRKQFGDAGGPANAGSRQTTHQPSALEAENRRLREENARLRMEREILPLEMSIRGFRLSSPPRAERVLSKAFAGGVFVGRC